MEDLPPTFYTSINFKGCKLQIKNVPKCMAREELTSKFKHFGYLEYFLTPSNEIGETTRTCYVKFFQLGGPLKLDLYTPNTTILGEEYPVEILPAKGENSRIYVANLGNVQVKDIFEQYGKIINCRLHKKNPKIVIITYEDSYQALRAVYNQHYSRIMDGCQQPLKVFYLDYLDKYEPNLGVFNVPEGCTELDMYRMFRDFGVILNITRRLDQGFITFYAQESARRACKNMDDFVCGNNRLYVLEL